MILWRDNDSGTMERSIYAMRKIGTMPDGFMPVTRFGLKWAY